MDAELLIMPELDLAKLKAVQKMIDSTMRQSAKRAGLAFQKEISMGILKGLAIGSTGGGIPLPKPSLPSASTPRASIVGPMLPTAIRAERRAAATEEARQDKLRRDFELRDINAQRRDVDAQRREEETRAKRWTAGGVAGRLKGSIKGANIFGLGAGSLAAVGGLAYLLAPTISHAGMGLAGLSMAGDTKERVDKAIEDYILNGKNQGMVNFSQTMGIDLGTALAMQSIGFGSGMSEGGLASAAGTIAAKIRAGDTYLSQFTGRSGGKGSLDVIASLANLSGEKQLEAIDQLGLDSLQMVPFLKELKDKTGGKQVTAEAILSLGRERQAQADKMAQAAQAEAQNRKKIMEETRDSAAQMAIELGKTGTIAQYLDNLKAADGSLKVAVQNYGAASDVSNQLQAAIDKLLPGALQSAQGMIPSINALTAAINKANEQYEKHGFWGSVAERLGLDADAKMDERDDKTRQELNQRVMINSGNPAMLGVSKY